MRQPEFLTYKERSIFYMDFSNLRTKEEIIELVDRSKLYIRKQSSSSLLTLTNVEGMHFNNEIKEVFSEFVKGNKPFVRAGAVVGLGGLMRIVYNGLMKLTGRDIRSFDDFTIAKEWLVGHN